jgi:hypothetical protein
MDGSQVAGLGGAALISDGAAIFEASKIRRGRRPPNDEGVDALTIRAPAAPK